MADFASQSSPTEKYKKLISSSLFMSSPRLFTSFTSKGFSDTTEVVMSPTSILDTKHFSSYNLKNPFWTDSPKSTSDQEIATITTTKPRPWDKGIGLGIVDVLNDEKSDETKSKSDTRMVLFGSHLKIQIPCSSPGDFGIKTRNSHLGFSPVEKSVSGSTRFGASDVIPMELSEDYTCVITHGPNPKTTHIFDNCIVEESCFGVVGFSGARKEDNQRAFESSAFPSENFLSFCFTCKTHLGQGKDIYMYRGEKAFCSHECRYEEMMLEEREDKLEFDGV